MAEAIRPLRLELHVRAERADKNRPAVAIVTGIVGVLKIRCDVDPAPDVKSVIPFHDILAAVVERAIA